MGGGEGYKRGVRQEVGQLGEGVDGGVGGQQGETREAVHEIPGPITVHIKPQQVASGINAVGEIPANGSSEQLPSGVNAKSCHHLRIAE